MKTKSADGVHVVVKDAFISKVPETGVTLVRPLFISPKPLRSKQELNLTLNLS